MKKGLSESQLQLDQRCINTIRTLAMDAIQAANSGHPGAPMGLAAAAYVLWTRCLRHNPKNPDWLDRDRFVLSGGHASMLIYSLLHLTGYDLSLDDIKNFRQEGSKTPGHPEYGVTPGVETTTGPLGQGVANAVGMAMTECHLAAKFNRPGNEIVDHYTYVMCGDGDMMEGVASEAVSLAGHLRLGKLICIYDDNRITIEGRTDISFTEDVALRFAAYNWHVQVVDDGNDVAAIENALQNAKNEKQKPSIILLRTHIAYGSPNKQDTPDAHGSPLGEAEICLTKECLGCPPESFCVPEDVLAEFRKCVEKGAAAETAWQRKYQNYTKSLPKLSNQWVDAVSGHLPKGWDSEIPIFQAADGAIATRAASGKVLNAIADRMPTLIGGSADLAPSNKTLINSAREFQPSSYMGRNIRFGVREHAMGAVMSGMFLHNGVRPYGGTFLVFADYMRPAIRVACLMKLPLIYVFTHDSIGVGEDGPTHQPVEHLAALRAIPGMSVIRPGDANETAEAWRLAIQSNDHPVALILSRQKLPVLDRDTYKIADGVQNGAYILDDCEGTPELILIGTGSEVSLALEAKTILTEKGIAVRVVSMPSWDLFEKTDLSYQQRVLPQQVTARIAIEAGVSLGWERYVGDRGKVLGMNRFGESAPASALMKKFNFTVEHVVTSALEMIGK